MLGWVSARRRGPRARSAAGRRWEPASSPRRGARARGRPPPTPRSWLLGRAVRAGGTGRRSALRSSAPIIVIDVPDLLTIDEALALVLERARPLPHEEVEVGAAAGRVLAADAVARVDLPPFPSSAMDGYAVRAAETPGTLVPAGQSAAGHPAQAPLAAGQAIAISTGAVVPAGADAVVPVERTRSDGGSVHVEHVAPGENVRPRGGDIKAGETVIPAGSSCGPAQLGALAAVGLETVWCARRPRVAVLATGSELRRPGEPLGPGGRTERRSGGKIRLRYPEGRDSLRLRRRRRPVSSYSSQGRGIDLRTSRWFQTCTSAASFLRAEEDREALAASLRWYGC